MMLLIGRIALIGSILFEHRKLARAREAEGNRFASLVLIFAASAINDMSAPLVDIVAISIYSEAESP